MKLSTLSTEPLSVDKQELLNDYKLAVISREISYLGRKEVLTGKAKFGILGDGKELPQIVWSKFFRPGDVRSGYYRDQTFAFAIGAMTFEQFFAQLYADADSEREPASSGRQMNGHFATEFIHPDGSWKKLSELKNIASDISPTGSQMPRLVGLAQASAIYRAHPEMDPEQNFSKGGNEIAWGTIGDASTAEGHFWESLNAICTLQVPMVLSIWDDGYGISVPKKYQRSKDNLSDVLVGFQRTEQEKGCEIIQVKGWDYAELTKAYAKAEYIARNEHVPVVIHVTELTQPQGHSTSGSHERYKSAERLQWEKEYDCIVKFKEWMLSEFSEISQEELEQIENEAKSIAKEAQKTAWTNYQNSIGKIYQQAIEWLKTIQPFSPVSSQIETDIKQLSEQKVKQKKEVFSILRKHLRKISAIEFPEKNSIMQEFKSVFEGEQINYSSHLYSEGNHSYKNVPLVGLEFNEESPMVDGRIVVRDNFDVLFSRYPNLVAFGEDVGYIGDVNQGFEGLQKKYGEGRIFDTGIREATIVGQAIGLAMRGIRPIAEIQYLDYILYGIQILSDDVSTLQYRTKGKQKVPLIIRTRGHRLEGIWHAGSPMGGLLSLLQGMLILVPRDLTRAAGFYNALMHCDDPAVIIEPLNGYRLKEKMPSNLGDFITPIGQVEITKIGTDLTVVTYGSTWRIVMAAAEELDQMGISVEVIDAQSLLPFDEGHQVKESLKKTSRLLIVDEDVPGGASAHLLHNILEEQQCFYLLDSPPQTLTAKAHRPPYASDGDYFSKPSKDDVVEKVMAIMHDANPGKYPPPILFGA